MTSSPPSKPKLYYITHIDNLQSIFSSGYLYSDARRIEMRLVSENIGMSSLKERRLHHQVACYPDTTVGQYVPFYFCPRSVMLFVIHKADHLELAYRGGQEPIVHLQVDLHTAVEWANKTEFRWAFCDAHAIAKIATFYNDLEHLDRIDWGAVAAIWWNQPEIQERKQAEFLIYECVPWNLVEKIGVSNTRRKNEVAKILRDSDHIPEIRIEPSWYY